MDLSVIWDTCKKFGSNRMKTAEELALFVKSPFQKKSQVHRMSPNDFGDTVKVPFISYTTTKPTPHPRVPTSSPFHSEIGHFNIFLFSYWPQCYISMKVLSIFSLVLFNSSFPSFQHHTWRWVGRTVSFLARQQC